MNYRDMEERVEVYRQKPVYIYKSGECLKGRGMAMKMAPLVLYASVPDHITICR